MLFWLFVVSWVPDQRHKSLKPPFSPFFPPLPARLCSFMWVTWRRALPRSDTLLRLKPQPSSSCSRTRCPVPPRRVGHLPLRSFASLLVPATSIPFACGSAIIGVLLLPLLGREHPIDLWFSSTWHIQWESTDTFWKNKRSSLIKKSFLKLKRLFNLLIVVGVVRVI